MKGSGLIETLRKVYGDKPFTKYEARKVYPAPSDYIDEVFRKAARLRILKPSEKCVCKPAYRIDPDESGRLTCSIDGKPYEESICPTITELIELFVALRRLKECILDNNRATKKDKRR